MARPALSTFKHMNHIGVKLLQRRQRHLVRMQCCLKSPPIFEDPPALIPLGKSEAEDFAAIEFAGPAGPGAESMHQPRKFCQRRNFKDAHARYVAFAPVVRRSRSSGLRCAL